MQRILNYILITLVMGLFGGCASSLTTQVKSFNQWPSDVQGASFSFDDDDANVANYLENKFYQHEIANQLEKLGLQQTTAAKTRFKVKLGLKNTSQTLESSSPVYKEDYFWVPGYVYVENNVKKVSPGYWASAGFSWIGTDRRQYVVYKYSLTIGIFDGVSKVFESTAQLESSKENVSEIVPYLIKSIFIDFPGNNGQVKKYKFDRKTGQLVP